MLSLLGSATLLAATTVVQADSQRIQWNSNKHFYQRFDQQITWGQAQANCKARGAHLVTITSDAERGFIEDKISSRQEFWIGASDTTLEGRLAWVNEERWGYEYGWGNTNTDSRDYAVMSYYYGRWDLISATETATYVCEWSANNYIGLANVPDLNGNGSPEIGVLYTEFGQPSVGIKDAKNDKVLLDTLRFLDANYNPKEISVYPDGNGYSDITVLGIRKTTNAPKAETRDSKTGKLLSDTPF